MNNPISGDEPARDRSPRDGDRRAIGARVASGPHEGPPHKDDVDEVPFLRSPPAAADRPW